MVGWTRPRLETRDISARELVLAALEQIDRCEARVRALLTVTADQALAAADGIDSRRAGGEALPIQVDVRDDAQVVLDHP